MQGGQRGGGDCFMLTDNIFLAAAHMLLAAFGALARQLYLVNKEPVKAAGYLSGCVIAAFMGLIIFFITENFELNQNLAYAVAGISGWIGPQLLDKLSKLVLNLAGFKLLDEGDENNRSSGQGM